ncbi:MAG: polyribonucleotide nucleotidyltransferase, partial [Patescibacteria group bacterium]
MVNAKKYAVEIGGKEISIEISSLAEQANGSVIVRHGETIVMVSCVMAKSQREGMDFFPLLVDYEERFYAAGKILGSRFIKREGRPAEEAILNARLIDRSIRPRFDQRMRNDVQVVAVILSYDGQNDPDIAALIGASAALSISNIPWDGPVAGVRVGRVDGKFIINPTHEEREKSDFDLLVAGMAEKINMIEAGAKEVPESVLVEAMEVAQKEIKKLADFQSSIVEEINPQKAKIEFKETNPEILEMLRKHISVRLADALFEKDKTARQLKVDELKNEWKAFLKEKYDEDEMKGGLRLFDNEIDHIVHKNILEKEKRADGRKLDELRELSAQAGFLPRAHGSGVFVRGQTKALSVLTLGGPGDQQFMEGMEFKGWKRFMHHYNFPGYSVGEVSPVRSTGRREIGHGALAEKAIKPLIPDEAEFPYTIRIVSEILSSNGSSSMASVCGSTLALMDAGVPIKNPAAGIAMGLMMDEEGNYKVLTDIQGPEDHHGDMDFKCAGTKDGVTALQMDVKIEGVTLRILKDTLEQARKARLEILETILGAISAPRPELSKYAPRILSLKINPEKIGRVIGPGGKVINEIIAVTGAAIDIEDDGSVFITSEKAESGQKAYDWV